MRKLNSPLIWIPLICLLFTGDWVFTTHAASFSEISGRFVGVVDFSVSCKSETQDAFNQSVAMLHHDGKRPRLRHAPLGSGHDLPSSPMGAAQ
jgi:hypothetical protein